MTTNQSIATTHPLLTAVSLALAAALALGLTRFSYALFLPWMVEDLNWSYTLAGSMNMANAAGYFIGATTAIWVFKRFNVAHALITCAIAASLLMGLTAWFTQFLPLFSLRLLAGVASAPLFVGGAVLAARLGNLHPDRAGLLIGIYYGGVGLGIILSSLLVPISVAWAEQVSYAHNWQPGWWWLGLTGLLLTALMTVPSLAIPTTAEHDTKPARSDKHRYLPMIAAYGLFGMGYIGYMTFVIAMLKEAGLNATTVYTFYITLGVSVMISARIWAALLDKYKGGETLAILNGLIGLACMIPAVITLIWLDKSVSGFAIIGIFLSGIVFGACFLSAVAATTVFVRHNLDPNQWVSGITVFTVVFGGGQVIGPLIAGWIADKANGLAWGLLVSAAILLIGSIVATFQKPLS